MLMTTSECLAKYGNFYRIAQAVRRGELYKVAHGVYSDDKRHRDVEMLLMKYPTSVVTMLSAYYYYGLTDNVPDKIHLAVERDGTKIRDANVVEYFVPKGTGGIGVVNAELHGMTLRIGTYEVSFRYASRGGTYANGCIYVKIVYSGNVETTLGSFDCPVTAFRTAYAKTYLAAGTYTLKLEHDKASSSGSGDSIIDRVEMKLMDNLISNGSFEDYRHESGDFTTYKTLVADTFLPEGWSWAKGSGGNVGLTKPYAGNPFVKDDFPDGNIVLYLQKASSISQTFIATTTGIHKVTFRYAGRGGYLKGRLHAKIDGNSLGYADCQTNLYHTICMETNLVAGDVWRGGLSEVCHFKPCRGGRRVRFVCVWSEDFRGGRIYNRVLSRGAVQFLKRGAGHCHDYRQRVAYV